MCGRFACASLAPDIETKLKEQGIKTHGWQDQERFHASYNVSPQKWIPVLRAQRNGDIVLQSMQWGFIPNWAKTKPNQKPINARDDTLLGDGSVFKKAKHSGRCIVIADGFYEWQTLAGGKKQPYYTKRKDGQLMLFAGLYSDSHLTDKPLYTCTIITTHASPFFQFLHDRMPVILEADQIETWLAPTKPWGVQHAQLLKPFEGKLLCYKVTEAVGSVHGNDANFVVPLDESKASITRYFQKVKTGDKRKAQEITSDAEPVKKKIVVKTEEVDEKPAS